MNYKIIGKSGLRVSELCLGAMTFGTEWGTGADFNTSKKIFETFIKAGGNFIDTANRYTEGTSEKWVGEFIAAERERFVVATKYTLYNHRGDPNSAGNHRKNLVQTLEKSLVNLKTPYIDILYLHAWDFTTGPDEVMRALDDLISSGKVLYIGISDTPAWIVSQCNTLAELRGWTKFILLQIEYSLLQRTPERDLLPMAEALGIAVAAWAPLGGGALTGKYLQKSTDNQPKRLKKDSTRLTERNTTIVKEVVKIAKEMGCKPAHIAIKWVQLQRNQLFPIVGARTLEQMKDNLQSLDIQLSSEHIQRLNEISKIELGFPHDFLKTNTVKELIYPGFYDKMVF